MSAFVMVIDDSLVIRKILETCLHRAGYEVKSFPDGVEALRWCATPEARIPALVLVDLGLPRLDGYEVIRHLKAQPAFAQTRFVIVSCRDGVLDRIKGRLVGVHAYLTKPFTTAEILAVVQAHLETPTGRTTGARAAAVAHRGYARSEPGHSHDGYHHLTEGRVFQTRRVVSHPYQHGEGSTREMKHTSASYACRRAGNKHSPPSSEPAGTSASVPYLPLGPHDLGSLEAVIRGYLASVRKAVPASAEQQAQIRTLQGIRARFVLLLAQGPPVTAHVPLTLEELIALKEAMRGFVALVRQMVPPSQERDGVIESLENLHQAIAGMLAP